MSPTRVCYEAEVGISVLELHGQSDWFEKEVRGAFIRFFFTYLIFTLCVM